MEIKEMLNRIDILIKNPETSRAKELASVIALKDLRSCLQYMLDVKKKTGSEPNSFDILNWMDEHHTKGYPWRGIAILTTFGTACEGCSHIGTSAAMPPCSICSRNPSLKSDYYQKYKSQAQQELQRNDVSDSYKKRLMCFSEDYEDQWDFIHQTFCCPRFWYQYIEDSKIEYTGSYPVHFSSVPKEERERYRLYLAEKVAKDWHTTRDDVLQTYTLESAVNEFWEYRNR